MKKALKKTIRFMLAPFVLPDYIQYKKKDTRHRFKIPFSDIYPCIKDKTLTTAFDRHYVYHTSWAARVVKEINPKKHIDISSSLYFSGLVSAFIPVDFYDYRPANIGLSNLHSLRGDLMNLPFPSDSIVSISCMHTIEHIGLGRYGDPIDPEGDLKAINELKRVTAIGGSLLFVTPVGRPRIAWNAHRIYSYEQIVSAFEGFSLKEFSLIPENENVGGLIRNADPELVKKENYGCGCFWFIKN
jgi:SAM-dependent methyltransferase